LVININAKAEAAAASISKK